MPHKSMEELVEGLPHIQNAPSDGGVLKCIVVRPKLGERREVPDCVVSVLEGFEGDRWFWDSWRMTEDGKPHPDVQLCIMNSRCIDLIAGTRERWALAGNNLLIDMDLSLANLPPGSRLSIGSVVIEITEEPHFACKSFIERYGRIAGVFLNTGTGRAERLRGRYAKVVEGGKLALGDTVYKKYS